MATAPNPDDLLPQVKPPSVGKPANVITVQDRDNDLMDTGRFEQIQRVASVMACGTLVPKHLVATVDEHPKSPKDVQKTMANCFRVCNQAMRWGFDPFAVVDETYVVHGRLGYQGKLVAAVINAKAGLGSNLQYRFNNETGPKLAVVCFGCDEEKLPDGAAALLRKYCAAEDREALNDLLDMGVYPVRVSVAQAATDNEMWKKDPEQKLTYNGAIKWARRYRPELVMGVLTEDDMDAIASRETAREGRPSAGTMDALTNRLENRVASIGQTSNGNGNTLEGSVAPSPNFAGTSVTVQPGTAGTVTINGEANTSTVTSPINGVSVTTEPITVEQVNGANFGNKEAGTTTPERFANFDPDDIPAGLEAFAAACDRAITDDEVDAAYKQHAAGVADGPAAEWVALLVDFTIHQIGEPMRPEAAAYQQRIAKAGTPSGLARLLSDAEADAGMEALWTPREMARFKAEAAKKFPNATKKPTETTPDK